MHDVRNIRMSYTNNLIFLQINIETAVFIST